MQTAKPRVHPARKGEVRIVHGSHQGECSQTLRVSIQHLFERQRHPKCGENQRPANETAKKPKTQSQGSTAKPTIVSPISHVFSGWDLHYFINIPDNRIVLLMRIK